MTPLLIWTETAWPGRPSRRGCLKNELERIYRHSDNQRACPNRGAAGADTERARLNRCYLYSMSLRSRSLLSGRARPTSTLLFALLALFLFGLSPGSSVASPINAELRPSGKFAKIPEGAPSPVRKMIIAGNSITNRKYLWGGGHSWRFNRAGQLRRERGYDCSGAVGFLLQRAGLLDSPLNSSGFMRYAKPGRGQWITIYANREHVFMTVAGLRWDTSYISDGDRSGPGWSETMRPTRGFKIRRVFVPAD